jgi:hypothetical protein
MLRTRKALRFVAATIRRAITITRLAGRIAAPLLDLFVRLWLGGIFWALGIASMIGMEEPQNWATTAYTHRVAGFGETIELVSALLRAASSTQLSP